MRRKCPSSTKSKILGDFLTPTTCRSMACSTPVPRSGVSKLGLDGTPAFLRRNSQRADLGKGNVLGDEEGVSWSPIAIRRPPKAAGRGLSALVRGLREMEDEGLDEGLELLREMESESALRRHLDQPKILVDDSQGPDVPLGPDGGLESDEDGVEDVDEGRGKDGRALKVWKKKGQKRTTRKVLMRPNATKWKPEPAWKAGQGDGDEENGVAETQTVSADRSADWKAQGCNSGYEDTEDCQQMIQADNARRDTFDKELEKEEVIASKVKKKISATANANFRALKIKNKQSKGKKGGRFGRKR